MTEPMEAKRPIPGRTRWRCPECGVDWIEDGEGAQDMPAECGPCGGTEMHIVSDPPPAPVDERRWCAITRRDLDELCALRQVSDEDAQLRWENARLTEPPSLDQALSLLETAEAERDEAIDKLREAVAVLDSPHATQNFAAEVSRDNARLQASLAHLREALDQALRERDELAEKVDRLNKAFKRLKEAIDRDALVLYNAGLTARAEAAEAQRDR